MAGRSGEQLIRDTQAVQSSRMSTTIMSEESNESSSPGVIIAHSLDSTDTISYPSLSSAFVHSFPTNPSLPAMKNFIALWLEACSLQQEKCAHPSEHPQISIRLRVGCNVLCSCESCQIDGLVHSVIHNKLDFARKLRISNSSIVCRKVSSW